MASTEFGNRTTGGIQPTWTRRWSAWVERLVQFAFGTCALIALGASVILLSLLINTAAPFFLDLTNDVVVGLADSSWQPATAIPQLGVAPLFRGTLLMASVALVFATPLGTAAAIYISEFASPRFRSMSLTGLLILSRIPTVVLGAFAIFIVLPVANRFVESSHMARAWTVAFVLTFMLVPTVVRYCWTVLQAIPQSIRESALALGSSPADVAWRVTLPAASSGILAAACIAVARAVGETMIVAIVLQWSLPPGNSLLDGVETITTGIFEALASNKPADSVTFQVLFMLAALLLVFTYLLNFVGHTLLFRLTRRFKALAR